MLFSANFAEAAIDALLEYIRHDAAKSDPQPWLMLLDLNNVTDRRNAFELIAERYAQTFPDARVPHWGVPAPVEAANTIAFKGVLTKPEDLGDLYKRACERKILAIDMGGVERIAYSYAGAFVETLKALTAGGKRVMLVNVAEVHATLLEIFGAHRHAVLIRRKGNAAEAALLAA